MPRKVPTPAKASRRVTAAELARILGVRSQGIYAKIKAGIIERGADGLIDLELAKVAIATRVRASGKTAAAVTKAPPAATGPAPAPAADPPHVLTYQTARAERESEEALIARMKRLEKERKLIERDPTIAAVFTAFRTLRDSVMPLGRRVAARLATMTDARDIQQVIDDELRLVLQTFSERTLAAVATKLSGQAPLEQRPTENLTQEAA